jgi:hypothetical protein
MTAVMKLCALMSDPVQSLLREKRAREAATAEMVQRVDTEMRTIMDTGVRPNPQLQGVHAQQQYQDHLAQRRHPEILEHLSARMTVRPGGGGVAPL